MKKGKYFINPHLEVGHRPGWDMLLWKMGYYNDPSPSLPPPAEFSYPVPIKQFDRSQPSVVWIGHCTFLIEIDGLTILTDPIWDNHCCPVPLPSFKRYSEPALPLADLPRIDLVLISHNHYDHLSSRTVSALHRMHPEIQWIIPTGLSRWFHRRGIRSVTEVGWWQQHANRNYSVTGVPTQHFSGRFLFDHNKSHWNGYVFEVGEKRFYFSGDTSYNSKDFKAIGERWPHMDLSMIPIGTYTPQKLMQEIHINPKEAVEIHHDVRSRLSLGMHWNTFPLSDEPADRPPYDLYLAMLEKGLPFEHFLPIDIGTYVNW